jgi:RND family efflux transporter MFP subunit
MNQDYRFPNGSDPSSSRPKATRTVLLRYVLPLLILAGAIAVTTWMMQTGPQAKPRPKTRNATLVEVRPIVIAAQQTLLRAMGTVKPAREVQLMPQVSGEVIELGRQLVPGGFFARGETLLTIDPTDYRLTVRQLESDVAKVEAELQLEQGKQLVARREYELLGEEVNPDEELLLLRQPQLDSLQASLDTAKIRLEQARINLERTRISAPFNAVVQTRNINLGTRVSTATPLATLIGTDTYWVEVSLPASQLRWIEVPREAGEAGSTVRIYDEAAWGNGVYRSGKIIRMAAAVEQAGRMARLLVEVDDPLARKPTHTDQPAMLIGAYVRVEISGREVAAAVSLAPELVREGDKIWIMNTEDRLEIRPVDVLFRGQDQVLIGGGITAGERLVVSDLPSPVAGMQLRLQENAEATPVTAPAATDSKDRPS